MLTCADDIAQRGVIMAHLLQFNVCAINFMLTSYCLLTSSGVYFYKWLRITVSSYARLDLDNTSIDEGY